MPFIATWMDLEIILISEISQTEENKYMILLYIKFFKDDTCKLIYKKETDSQAQRVNYGYWEERQGEGIDWEFEIDIFVQSFSHV